MKQFKRNTNSQPYNFFFFFFNFLVAARLARNKHWNADNKMERKDTASLILGPD